MNDLRCTRVTFEIGLWLVIADPAQRNWDVQNAAVGVYETYRPHSFKIIVAQARQAIREVKKMKKQLA